MKTLNENDPALKSAIICKTTFLAWVLMLFAFSNAYASPIQEKEKARVRMSLNYFKIAEDSCDLTVKVLTRQDRKYVPVSGIIINLFLNEQTKSGMMGNITTDEEGLGSFILPDKFYMALDTLTTFEFFARLKNDPNYQDKITSLEVRDASMTVAYYDSLKEIKVTLLEKDSTGLGVPVEDADIKFYVKRLFSLLPVGGDNNFTDEEGGVSINFPTNLPGDADGNLEVVIKLEDDEYYGNIIVSKTLPWGSDLLIHKDTFDQRTMWSSRDKTPWYLLIFPNLILLTVWGVIFYLIMQLVKIYRIGKKI